MQVSSTLIAAQQAAREAQAKFHASQPGFATALKDATGDSQAGFSPLPLKQTVAAAPPVAPMQQGARIGAQLDIKV